MKLCGPKYLQPETIVPEVNGHKRSLERVGISNHSNAIIKMLVVKTKILYPPECEE
jgi:hypothetical protein